MDTREELIVKTASRIHENWCLEDLQEFYKRAREAKETGMSEGETLTSACFQNGYQVNEVLIDIPFLTAHETLASSCFTSFDNFLELVQHDAIEVRKYVKRDLTEKEIEENLIDNNYKVETGEENILRPFAKLSADSRREYLEVAIACFKTYSEMSKAGISIDQMEKSQEIRDMVGLSINNNLLRRNMEYIDESLIVPYSQLDDYVKEQDLKAFDTLINTVKSNINKYEVKKEEGYSLPNYLEEQERILETTHKGTSK